MLYQAIIETASGLDTLAVDPLGNYVIGNDVVGELAAMRAEWANVECPEGGRMMADTRIHDNRKVTHVILDITSEDPLGLLHGLIAGYSLDWTVWGFCSLRKHLIVNVDGDPVLDADGQRQFAQIVDMPVPQSFVDFLADKVDADGNVSRPTTVTTLHSYVGAESMAI